MISSISWIPRGVAKETPEKYQYSKKEIEDLERLSKVMMEKEERMENDKKTSEGLDRHGLPVELRMDDYNEDYDDLQWETNNQEFQLDEEAMLIAQYNKVEPNEASESDSEDDSEDEEMEDSNPKEAEEDDADQNDNDDEEKDDDDDDDDDDIEDVKIKETDQLIVVASTDEEYSNLEVYLYDPETGSMYVHHDILLAAFPLCTEWMGIRSNVLDVVSDDITTNFCAVGTFSPVIEIYNLDVLETLEPCFTLEGHENSVMGLSWNFNHHHLLASGSADNTVKIWDLNRKSCVQTFKHHKDKVQSVGWNPVETNVLLSGSFDKTLGVFDAKVNSSKVLSMKVTADIECCIWNRHRPEQVLAATEDGNVTCFDVRSPKAPLYSFKAHDRKPCSAISMSYSARGLLATCSPDKSVKLWDVEANEGKQPKCLGSKVMASTGALFDCAFDINEPFTLAAGGDGGSLALWDTSEEGDIENLFKDRMVSPSFTGKSPEMVFDSKDVNIDDAAGVAEKKRKKKKSKKKRKQ